MLSSRNAFPAKPWFMLCYFLYFNNKSLKKHIKILLTAGVPLSQALPGFLITAPSVCVSAVIGALAVWIRNQKKQKKRHYTSELPEEYKLVNIPARRTLLLLLCCGVNRLTVSVSLTSLEMGLHPPSPSKFTPFCFGRFSSIAEFFTLLIGVAYSVSKSESSSSSEVRNYDHHRWETN